MGGGGTDFDVNWQFMKDNDIAPRSSNVYGRLSRNSWGDPDYCDTVFIIHGNKDIVPPLETMLTMNKVNNTMIKVFKSTAVDHSPYYLASRTTTNAQALWMQKSVQCMPQCRSLQVLEQLDTSPLVGGLGVGTMADTTTTFDVAVVYWTQPDTDNWFISESDKAGTTCMLGNGNNNNSDTDPPSSTR